MIYKALLTDEFLSYFRLDDNGKTLVLTDKTGLTRAVTLEKVKHGKWEKVPSFLPNYQYFVCSVCMTEALQDENGVVQSKFCPNCGADMRERKDND